MKDILTPEVISTIITVCVIPMLGALTKYCIAYIQKKTQELENNIHNDEVKKYVDIAEDAVCTAVAAVSQTMVDTLKKNNTFNQIAAEEAFATAKQQSLAIMGAKAQEILKEAYGDINIWLNNKIEYYVNKNKK